LTNLGYGLSINSIFFNIIRYFRRILLYNALQRVFETFLVHFCLITSICNDVIWFFRKNIDEYFLNLARDNTQLLINEIWKCPKHRVDDVTVAKLPNQTTVLPRALPVPRPRELTKWEKFAKEKGIQKKKKDKLKWDDILKVSNKNVSKIQVCVDRIYLYSFIFGSNLLDLIETPNYESLYWSYNFRNGCRFTAINERKRIRRETG